MAAAPGVNEEQHRAATMHLTDRTALLIVGGPGSGKTQTMAHRCAQLVDPAGPAAAPPESLLVLTFTREAAGSMVRRICAMVGPAGADILAGTFHSVAHLVFRTHTPERRYLILDEDSRSILRPRRITRSVLTSVSGSWWMPTHAPLTKIVS